MRRSVNVALRGGLGNQLFGWAAGYALAQRLSTPLKLNGQLIHRVDHNLLDTRHFELSYFGLKASGSVPSRLYKSALRGHGRWSKVLQASLLTHVFRESDFGFDHRFLDISAPLTLDGYFQSWKYFEGFEQQIRAILMRPRLMTHQARLLAAELIAEPWIGVHVRRGDYLKVGIFAVPGANYYREALTIAAQNSEARRVVVFSDDIDVARTVVPNAHKYVGSGDIANPGDVLNLLSYSAAFVGANSSFSWWASYMLRNPTVPRVFPKRWFTNREITLEDLLPAGWLAIEA